MDDSPNTFDPAQALNAVHEARAALSARLDQGAWRYDLIYSLLAGLAVGAQALPVPFNIAGSAVGAISLALLARDYARRTGVWVCGSTPRRARWASMGLGVVIAGLCMVSFMAADHGQAWVGLLASAAAMAAALVASRLWRRLFRLDLLDERPTPPRPYGLMLVFGAASGLLAGGLYVGGAEPAIVGMALGICLSMMGLSGFFLLRRGMRAAR